MHTLIKHRIRSQASTRLPLCLMILLLSLFVAADLHAQTLMPLPSYSNTYNGNTRGFWFQAPADFRIVGVRVPTDVGTGVQNVQVFKLPGQPLQWPSLNSTYTTLGVWTNVNSSTMIPCDILISSGEYIGLIGSRGQNGSTQANSYSTQNDPYTMNNAIFGLPVTLHRFGHQGTTYPITGDVFWEPNYQICRVEVYYAPAVTVPNDIGIASIDSPVNFCSGTNDMKVMLKNFGTNQITSAQIHWTVNGVSQPVHNWSGLLDTLSVATRATQVTLGTLNLQSGFPYTFTAWTAMPNGVQDTMTSNDTASHSGQAALDGVFTVGGSSPDYPTLDAALIDLHAFGLCGPVVYRLRPGTYNEQIVIGGAKYGGSVNGVSDVNTITFESETGNRADVTVTYHSQTGNPTVHITSTNYVTIRDLTITATNASNCRCLHITGGSEHCTFENVDMISPMTTTISNVTAVVESPSGSLDHYMTFRNCSFQGGSYGMYLYGSGTTSTEDNMTIENCQFTGQYYRPLYSYYLGKMNFIDNTVEFTSNYSGNYLAMFYYGYDMNIERNRFLSTAGSYAYGIYMYYNNYYMNGSNRFVNNMVSVLNTTSTTYGVRPYYTNNLLFAHNTVHLNSTYSTAYNVYSYYGSNHEYYNNIFYNTGPGRTWYVPSSSAITASDYNVFLSNGSVLAYWTGNRADLPALQAASGMDQHSISKQVAFVDAMSGDLHLASPSDDDSELFGLLMPEVAIDIDHDTRVNPYRGADEACYIVPGSLTYEFVDGAGMPAGYAEVPGSIGVRYGVTFPEYASTVTFTVQFYNPVTSALVYQTSFSAAKQYGVPLQGTKYITLPSTLPPGYYRMEVLFNTKNSCDVYRDYMPYSSALLVVPEGRIPCVVWPGDVNNDGVVSYADRRALNTYIYDANLRTSWLNGPQRYQADAESNPFTYLEWKPQAGAPWQTPDGCYMDTDGNGVVNNLDYIAMKLNWSKMTPWYGGSPKYDASSPSGFMMDQNYPNPFNPSTVIRFTVPEKSHVRLVVNDALGRTIAEPLNGHVEKGPHEVQFDGTNLSSGTYTATVVMTAVESGMTFTKTIKMALMR